MKTLLFLVIVCSSQKAVSQTTDWSNCKPNIPVHIRLDSFYKKNTIDKSGSICNPCYVVKATDSLLKVVSFRVTIDACTQYSIAKDIVEFSVIGDTIPPKISSMIRNSYKKNLISFECIRVQYQKKHTYTLQRFDYK